MDLAIRHLDHVLATLLEGSGSSSKGEYGNLETVIQSDFAQFDCCHGGVILAAKYVSGD